jgi:molybdopterin molybdotransferase
LKDDETPVEGPVDQGPVDQVLSIAEALDAVLSRVQPVSGSWLALSRALGCVAGDDVAADLDLPPFDKSLVDGYAIRTGDLAGSDRALSAGEVITAGQVPTRPLAPHEAAVIMTGAPVPAGADAVVMHERTRRDQAGVWIDQTDVRSGQNILPRGRELRKGAIVISAGSLLNPARLGLLAAVGQARLRIRQPRVVVVPTGDELVEADVMPGPGQIRNSNAVMLQALATRDGACAEASPILRDEPRALAGGLEQGLRADVMIVSGGVSAGEKDLVPAALRDLGVACVFHKVRIKPGKPLWFGVGPARGPNPGTLVFGLPGNPVSSLVCYLVCIRPALHAMESRPVVPAQPRSLQLAGRFAHCGERPTYFPARLVAEPGRTLVETLDWAGSADLYTVACADGFAVFPAGDRDYIPGEPVDFLAMD